MSGAKKTFRFREERLEYDLKLRKPFPWWVFLFLLPLLLLIRCQRDLTVHCYEAETGEPFLFQDVTLTYTDHFIEKTGRWLSSDTLQLIRQTDTCGVAHFEKLPCSVYSYIFYALQKGHLSLDGECFEAVDRSFIFHYTRKVSLSVDARRNDLRVRVVDAETGLPLSRAMVQYYYKEKGKSLLDSVQTDLTGIAILPRMRYCSEIDTLLGRCFGYYDDVRTRVPCRELLLEQDATDLRLQPVKERFTFFVRNAETKEPIPDAICNVTLTPLGNVQKTVSREVRTSIDGRGVAVYDDAPVLSTIAIHVSKMNYKDSVLVDGPHGAWRVAEFIKQKDDTRTIWLEPQVFLQEFVNIDSLSMLPIPGVINEITVIRPDGTKTSVTEISNLNGVFPVNAREEDKIEIVSRLGSDYKVKHTVFPKFKKVENKSILMQPEMLELEFRTVQADSPFLLLPDCSLSVTGSISGLLSPGNSGNGVFTVLMRKAEKISIVASKKDFKTNDTAIRDMGTAYLSATQYRRDIPMEWNLPPCNGGVQESYEGPGTSTNSYSMGQISGTASIWVDFLSIGDYLTVYDGTSASGVPIISRSFIEYKRVIPFSFTKGAVTVVIESGPRSGGYFEVRCPTN